MALRAAMHRLPRKLREREPEDKSTQFAQSKQQRKESFPPMAKKKGGTKVSERDSTDTRLCCEVNLFLWLDQDAIEHTASSERGYPDCSSASNS